MAVARDEDENDVGVQRQFLHERERQGHEEVRPTLKEVHRWNGREAELLQNTEVEEERTRATADEEGVGRERPIPKGVALVVLDGHITTEKERTPERRLLLPKATDEAAGIPERAVDRLLQGDWIREVLLASSYRHVVIILIHAASRTPRHLP